MGLIFNEKIPEKWDLWIPWTVHRTHWCAEKSNITATVHEQCMNSSRNSVLCSWNACQKKKRVKHANAQTGRRNVYPNGYYISTHLPQNKVSLFRIVPKRLKFQNLREILTLPSEGSWLVLLGHLWLLLFLFKPFWSLKPGASNPLISYDHQFLLLLVFLTKFLYKLVWRKILQTLHISLYWVWILKI